MSLGHIPSIHNPEFSQNLIHLFLKELLWDFYKSQEFLFIRSLLGISGSGQTR